MHIISSHLQPGMRGLLGRNRFDGKAGTGKAGVGKPRIGRVGVSRAGVSRAGVFRIGVSRTGVSRIGVSRAGSVEVAGRVDFCFGREHIYGALSVCSSCRYCEAYPEPRWRVVWTSFFASQLRIVDTYAASLRIMLVIVTSWTYRGPRSCHCQGT
jgi:hypothetical protein